MLLYAVTTIQKIVESGVAQLANQPTIGLYYLRVWLSNTSLMYFGPNRHVVDLLPLTSATSQRVLAGARSIGNTGAAAGP